MGIFLLAIPALFAALCGVLALTAYAENRILNPRSMILTAVRARGSTPEYAEAFVAREIDRLLAQSER